MTRSNVNHKEISSGMIQCGESSYNQIYIEESSSTCDANDHECHNRSYQLFIPKKVCHDQTGGIDVDVDVDVDVDIDNNIDNNIGIVPLVFALHGYGGSSSNMITWEKVADDFGFVLVRPEGMYVRMYVCMCNN